MTESSRLEAYVNAWRALPRWRRSILVITALIGLPLTAICVRSYFNQVTNFPDLSDPNHTFPTVLIHVRNGELRVEYAPQDSAWQNSGPDDWRFGWENANVGFTGSYVQRGNIHGIYYWTTFPLWLIAYPCAAIAITWICRTDLRFDRSRERRRAKRCVECDYDLRGHAGRPDCVCPECGRRSKISDLACRPLNSTPTPTRRAQ